MVVMEPSWPVFMAWSMSRVAPSRTSPTMIRSGRMRSALRTRSRIVISPRFSRLAGRASSRSTCSWRSCSSAASSMVMIRSSSGMKADSTFSVVVLPEPVPPLITMFSRPCTQSRSRSATCGVIVPNAMRWPTPVSGSAANFRIVSSEPSSATGGTTALTRLPSGSRASTIGLDSSTRRPTRATILSMVRRRWLSSANDAATGYRRPSRST